jgi:hypothetical protein
MFTNGHVVRTTIRHLQYKQLDHQGCLICLNILQSSCQQTVGQKAPQVSCFSAHFVQVCPYPLLCSPADITPVSGPNGHEDFLNCGLTYGGWTPPMLHVSELVTVSLSTDGPLAPCASLVDLFTRYAQPFGCE